MNSGDLLLKLAFVLAIVAFVAALRWARGRKPSETTFRWAYHAMTAVLTLGCVLLMIAILRHDFRFAYVVSYSSTEMPLLYLISGFWAGQQGTYLLWAWIAALVGYALIRRRSWEPAMVMACYVPTVAFLIGLMLNSDGNPFRMLAAGRIPPDGNGLNPLLQDPWMASHPPLVFLGYATTTVPAVLALVALIRRRDSEWLAPALRWTLISFVTLGAGIILGGFWAYKVLGWGGYWGWDPVENASLIPWIVITALLHGILVQQGSGALRRTNLFLALSGYLLVFYATFLTRSGVLADFSVHSFPAGSIYKILVAIMATIVVASAVGFFRSKIGLGKDVPTELSWPFTLSIVIALFGFSAGLVLIGTSWPIITSFAKDLPLVSNWIDKPSALNPSFYNNSSLPVYVGLLAVLGVAPFLAWGRRPWSHLAPRVLGTLATAAVGTIIAVRFGAEGFGPLTLFFVAVWGLASNVVRLTEVARARLLNSGAALAHIGFAMMLLGIVTSSAWGVKQEAALALDRPTEVLGRTLTYSGHVPGSEPQDQWRVVVEPGDGREIFSDVTMFRFGGYNGQESTLHKPAILRSLAGDLYVAPQGLDVESGDRSIELARGTAVPGPEGSTLVFTGFETQHDGSSGSMIVQAKVTVRRDDDSEDLTLPMIVSQGGSETPAVASQLVAGTQFRLQRMSVEQGRVLVQVAGPGGGATEVLYVEVSTKPMIGVLWAGTILMSIGCGVAVTRRWVDARSVALAAERAAAAGGRKPSRRRGVAGTKAARLSHAGR